MDSFKDFVKDNRFYIAAGSAVVGTSLLLYKTFRKRTRTCGVDYPKDTVIVHSFPGNTHIPALSHFVMKLETYLRINNIPYQLDFSYEGGPKNKIPWIEYNGVTMGDSQLIMEYLNKNFHIDINSHLNEQERAIAWAIQKWLEEFTYWLNVHTRWAISPGETLKKMNLAGFQAAFIKLLVLPKILKMTYIVGVGRHSNDEIGHMVVKDIRQFSAILGAKKFIMGDKITEADCAAFGVLSEIRWCTPESCPGNQLLASGEVQNVTDYLDRIKNTYWKDWDKLLADAKK